MPELDPPDRPEVGGDEVHADGPDCMPVRGDRHRKPQRFHGRLRRVGHGGSHRRAAPRGHRARHRDLESVAGEKGYRRRRRDPDRCLRVDEHEPTADDRRDAVRLPGHESDAPADQRRRRSRAGGDERREHLPVYEVGNCDAVARADVRPGPVVGDRDRARSGRGLQVHDVGAQHTEPVRFGFHARRADGDDADVGAGGTQAEEDGESLAPRVGGGAGDVVVAVELHGARVRADRRPVQGRAQPVDLLLRLGDRRLRRRARP